MLENSPVSEEVELKGCSFSLDYENKRENEVSTFIT